MTSLGAYNSLSGGGGYPQILHSSLLFIFGSRILRVLEGVCIPKNRSDSTVILLITGTYFLSFHDFFTEFAIFCLSISRCNLYLSLGQKEKRVSNLSALLVGLSTWTRSVEPFWVAILIDCLFRFFLIYSKKVWSVAIFSLLLFPIRE